ILIVRPGTSTQFIENENQSLLFQADHIAGYSDGIVSILVVDPFEITGQDYEVRFRYNTENSTISWDLIDISDNITVISGNTIQNGIDMETGGEVGEGANPIVEGLQIVVSSPSNEFKDFYVTQNAGGPIDGNAGAAADYYSYPGMGRDNIENQQSNGSRWFITTSNGSNKNYEDFFPYVTRYAGGYGNPDGGMQYLIPDDYEFRFTATGSKMLNRGTELVVDTPLEIWNIGDVSDPDDDFQLMGIFNDSNEDGEWNMYQDDSPISGGTNDPYMEGFYVLEHADRAPGTAGYLAMVDALTADPNASGAYIWATGPGLPLSVEGQITRVVLLNMTFVEWNGGDVEAANWPADVTSLVPETGTIFRMVTTKPNSPRDVYFFSTDSLKPAVLEYSPKLINVWPNPYFAYNPEERTPSERKVMFTHLPETATIRIFDLAGNLIRIIQHSDGSQYALWDLRNMANRLVSSGMYIAHIETAFGDQILKVAVIQPK
ncbi:MAG: T9SS type A sorting domain-containing protein, partial [Candidatus Marinimicrobia bacterium]|nr:T9SS type A sorting domain-containing protein [Candidatus Neomarinimicrobiota bacterium]